MSWQTAKLGDVLTLKRGYDLPNRARKPGDVPIVSSSGVTGSHNVAKVAAPGVVTGRYGTLGEVFYLTEDFWPLNTSLYVQDFKGNHPRWISYFLKQTLGRPTSNKAAVPGVNRNDLHARTVRYPDTDTQKRIANILSTYDNLIENNRRRIQLLEQAARLLYKEWFVHLRFPGHEHVKIIDDVPEGWSQGVISDLGEVITGKTPSKKRASYYGGDIPFIKTPDMHGNSIVIQTEDRLTEEGANSQANKMLPPRSILVSCIGTVGAVSFNATTAQTNQQINAIIPKNEFLRYWTFFSAKDLKPLLEGVGGDVTMTNVNKTKFSGIQVIIPPPLLLETFNLIVAPMFDQLEMLLLMNKQSAQARDLLLPRLMNGEIAV